MMFGSRTKIAFVTLPAVMAISLVVSANQQTPTFEDEPLAQACQFNSLSDLNLEAKNILTQFSNITNFDPFFWEPDKSRREEERSRATKKSQSIIEQKTKLDDDLQIVHSIFDELVALPPLRSYKTGFLGVDLSTTCDLACTQSVFIGVNQQWVKSLIEKYPDSFAEILRFTIAHEIGHNIFDFNLWFSNSFENIDAYREHFKTLNYRKLHLTIDAIGMLLGDLNPVQAVAILESTANTLDSSKGTGDIARRIFCLRNLK